MKIFERFELKSVKTSSVNCLKKKNLIMLQQAYLIFSIIIFVLSFTVFGIILFVDFVFTRFVLCLLFQFETKKNLHNN